LLKRIGLSYPGEERGRQILYLSSGRPKGVSYFGEMDVFFRFLTHHIQELRFFLKRGLSFSKQEFQIVGIF
jgi:hypothetical protein